MWGILWWVCGFVACTRRLCSLAGLTRFGDGGDGEAVGELDVIWGEVDVVVPEFVPFEAFAGVGCFAAEDAERGGFCHVFACVDGLASAKACEEFIVADLIHVGDVVVTWTVAPGHFTFGILNAAHAWGIHGAIFTGDAVYDFGVAFRVELALTNVAHDAIWIFIGNIVVIEDIRLVVAGLATSGSHDGDWVDVIHGPGNFIDGVDTLLNEVCCGEPLEVLPVAELELYVAHAFWFFNTICKGGNGVGHVGAVN